MNYEGIAPEFRIYYEPPWTDDIEPDVYASYNGGIDIGPDGVGEIWLDLEPVDGLAFVLQPEIDKHARTAMIMYALMIMNEDEGRGRALLEVLR